MPLGRRVRSGGFAKANRVLAIEGIDLDAGSCHQGWRIDNFEPVVGEADDLLFAKYVQRLADVNVGKTESLADMALAQRQLYDLTRLGRKAAAYPHIDLEQHFVARISSRANLAPRIHFHMRRTYSGRPSSSMRFSDATAIASSVVCRPSVRERSASLITRL